MDFKSSRASANLHARQELIGEGVRDKVAASKKKGMWMGGTVPLGYDAKDRKLEILREIMQEKAPCGMPDDISYIRVDGAKKTCALP